jgi:predicted branched-subunit amino acid permease
MTATTVPTSPDTTSVARHRSEVGTSPTARAELIDGGRTMVPWLVGIVPYGLVIGATVGASSMAPAAGLATGATIYSGSSQLAAIDLVERGAAPIVAIATVLAINARLIFYSGSMAPHWQGTSRWFRVVASYLLIDPSYAVGKAGYADGHPRHLHYLGAGLTLWVSWQVAILGGYVAGTRVPATLHLEHAVPLFLVAEVAHSARTSPTRTAAAVGALVALGGSGLPLHAGPLAGIVAGIAAACAVDRRQP